MGKEIQLTQGKVALVDDEDYDHLSQWSWYFSDGGYALNRTSGKTLRMHRIVNKTPDGMETDHINRDRLDNRRENLRTCSHRRNSANRPQNKARSGYKGVYKRKNGTWRARIEHRAKVYNLGTFDTPEGAAMAYNNRATEFFGDFAFLNNIGEK